MKKTRQFNYGQWTITIELKEMYNQYRHEDEFYCSIDCTGNWYSTQGIYYQNTKLNYVASYDDNIVPHNLKHKIDYSCSRLILSAYTEKERQKAV